jgi:hypothetical protein
VRKITAGLFISLDGVVEAPERWTGPYVNDQVGRAVGALMAQNDALLLGRVTYEGFSAAFGGQSGGMADQMNTTPKFVVSSTLTSADWQNSTLIKDDAVGQIAELKQQSGRGASGTLADLRYRAAVFQVDQPLTAQRRPHPAPDRAPEQSERVGDAGEPVLGNLLGLYRDSGQDLVFHAAAVEQEPDASGTARPRAAEIHAGQPRAA